MIDNQSLISLISVRKSWKVGLKIEAVELDIEDSDTGNLYIVLSDSTKLKSKFNLNKKSLLVETTRGKTVQYNNRLYRLIEILMK